MITNEQLHHTLKEVFGFTSFRPGQREAIETLLKHNRLLCIQPTGHGKSLLYQLPTCLFKGVTLVISPLLALMRDQLMQLKERFNISAASFNSDQTPEENQLARDALSAGEVRVLFISPEQLDHPDRFEFLLSIPLSLLVIDEAHCISTWGHDFRPSYRQILRFVQAVEEKQSDVRILALTATANAQVESDVKGQLSSSNKKIAVLRENMDRPNLFLRVHKTKGIASKLALCEKLLKEIDGNGLIYCATREHAELVAEYLLTKKISIVAYHAGLESELKREIQEGFSKDRYQVIAATTALGMGIDKGNLRFIIHFDIPGSITAYYQEVGRAGRDGRDAQGILLYNAADRKIQDYFIEAALPTPQDFDVVFNAVMHASEPPHLTTLKQLTGLHPTRVTLVLSELVEQGFVEKRSLGGVQVYVALKGTTASPLLEQGLKLERYTTQHGVKKQELSAMIAYAEKGSCRMGTLRLALGDKEAAPCGRCDLCLKQVRGAEVSLKEVEDADFWLQRRTVPIAEAKMSRLQEGASVLDSALRSPLFIQFMKERATSERISEELLCLLKEQAKKLADKQRIVAILPLPSKTWKGRDYVAAQLAHHLGVPVLGSTLYFEKPPEKRQGECLNNDQRKLNVQSTMEIRPPLRLPEGGILLLDDYTGSGATLKEAARALKKHTKNKLVPFTVAAVRWRLGQTGFV